MLSWLLSAPAEVILDRMTTRTTNDFGKDEEERRAILRDLDEIEARLRASCTHEVDATQPIDVVVEQLVRIGEGVGALGLEAKKPLDAPVFANVP